MAAFASANGFYLVPVGLLDCTASPRLCQVSGVMREQLRFAARRLPSYRYSRVPSTGEYRFLHHQAAFFFSCLPGLRRAVPFRWPAAALGLVMLGILGWRFAPASMVSIRLLFTSRCGFWRRQSWSAWVRGAVSFAIGSRYSIYSILLLVFCYSFLAHYLPNRWAAFDRERFTQLVLCSLSVSVYQPTCTLTKSSVRGAR